MATICSADRALQTDNFVLRSSVVMVPSQGVKRSISQSTSCHDHPRLSTKDAFAHNSAHYPSGCSCLANLGSFTHAICAARFQASGGE